MSGENYDEGIERANLIGAADHSNQSYLRDRQKKRMRDGIIGMSVAILLVITGLSYTAYVGEQQKQALALLGTSQLLLGQKEFTKSILTATKAIEIGHHQWHGYYARAVAHLNLGKIKDASLDIDKAVSFFAPDYRLLPLSFWDLYTLIHYNSIDSDEVVHAMKKNLISVTRRFPRGFCYQVIVQAHNEYVISEECISADFIENLISNQ